jgi:hypothetical protein
MDIGIIGLPLAGKTTVFNAVTRSNAQTGAYSSGRCQVQTAVVEVADPRVDVLSSMFKPRKTTRARVQFNDITGVSKGATEGSGLDPQVLNVLSKCDALLQVVRAFSDADVPHPEDSIDPARDLEALRLELIISDLIIVEHRTERLEAGLRRGPVDRRVAQESELALMRRFVAALEAGQLIGDLDMTDEERTLIRGFQFLTAKPAMVVVNEDEDADARDLSWTNHHRQTDALSLRGALEMEIAQLPPDETALFLATYGIVEPGLNLMVRRCYGLLGVMSFFTVGEDEVRAWTVRRGATAVEAAGAIHSDLARGFIRAEVLSYDDMIACGALAEARKRGKLRLEGRDYVVRDGDILNIRFNV